MGTEIARPLTEKECAFCLHVIQTDNVSEAYRIHISGGKCTTASAKVAGSRLASQPHIKQRLAEMRAGANARNVESGVNLLAYAVQVLIDITNKGRQTFRTAEGIEQYHSLPAARAAASELAKIHMADHDGTVKLDRLARLIALSEKGKISQDLLQDLAADVIHVRS